MKFSEVIKYYLQICWKFKKYYIPTILITVIAGIFSVYTPFVFKFVVDSVVSADFDKAQILILVFAGFIGAGEILANIACRIGDYLIISVQGEARLRFVNALQKMDFGFHVNKSSGSLIGKSKRGDSALNTLVENINMDGLWKLIGFIVAIAGTAFFNLKITGLLILLTLITALVQSFFIKINTQRRKQQIKLMTILVQLL